MTPEPLPVERAVLLVEVRDTHVACGCDERVKFAEKGWNVLDVMQRQQRTDDIILFVWSRAGREVELHGADVGGPDYRDLFTRDRGHLS